MKKLIGIVVLGLILSTSSFASYKSWSCKKYSEKYYICINAVNNLKIEYIGEIKNNKPNGYGTFKVLNKDISGEGIWKTSADNSPTMVEGSKILNGIKVLYKNSKAYEFIYKEGIIFQTKPRKVSSKDKTIGKMIYQNGDIFEGSVVSVLDPKLVEGIFYFNNGDKYEGSFKNNKPLNGDFFFSNGGIVKYKDGVGNSVKVKSKPKSYFNTQKISSSLYDNFLTTFILSWVFTGILWLIIIFYFKVLGSIGRITKKIDKKIPGTQNVAIITGSAVTWYLAWSFLVGFEIALLVNFVFIYLAIWSSITVFFLNIITKSMSGKAEIYISLFLGACSLGLAIEMIGPFIKFLKNINFVNI